MASTGKEGSTVETVGFGFGGNGKTSKGGGDVEGGGIVVRNDDGFIGDGELQGVQPLHKISCGFDGDDNELAVGGSPVEVEYVIDVPVGDAPFFFLWVGRCSASSSCRDGRTALAIEVEEVHPATSELGMWW